MGRRAKITSVAMLMLATTMEWCPIVSRLRHLGGC